MKLTGASVFASLIILLILSCGDPTPNPDTLGKNPLTQSQGSTNRFLKILDGEGQSGRVGEFLAKDLKVIAETRDGGPLVGANIRFSITHGSGVLSTATSITDSKGMMSTAFRLGIYSGDVFVRAELLPNDTGNFSQIVGFKITAEPGPPTNISVVSGNNQCTIENTTFAQPLAVTALDLYGNPISSISIEAQSSNGYLLNGTSTSVTYLSDEYGSILVPVRAGSADNPMDPNGSQVMVDFGIGSILTTRASLRTTRDYYFVPSGSRTVHMFACCPRCFCMPYGVKVQILHECNRPWQGEVVEFRYPPLNPDEPPPLIASVPTDSDGYATYTFMDNPCPANASSCTINAFHPIRDTDRKLPIAFTIYPPN